LLTPYIQSDSTSKVAKKLSGWDAAGIHPTFVYMSHGILYIKCMLVNLNHKKAPELSGQNSFSRTFQVLQMAGKNLGLSRRHGNPV